MMSFRWCLAAVVVGLVAVRIGYYICASGEASYENRFGSFAPVRYVHDSKVKWFVDGEDYMEAVADAIQNASNEIFVADWQLSPHIFMKRPGTGVVSLEWRLDKLLLRKAKEDGVRVYILLYSESERIADMKLGSSLVGSVLNHENIEVILHPGLSSMIWHGLSGSSWWSHHEKVVVVDRKLAFVGGIDLCFGRWDTHSHDLTDSHPCVQEYELNSDEGKGTKYCRWVGQDYGNTFVGGSRTELDNPLKDYIDRNHVPRMPWHDVACSFAGAPANDVATHFIQRYTYAKPWWQFWGLKWLYIEDYDNVITPDDESNVKIQVLRSVDNWSAGQLHEASVYSAYLHAIEHAEHFIYIENQFFISSQPGIFLKVENQIIAALVDRIYKAFQNNEDFRVIMVMPLKPEFPGEWCDDDSDSESDNVYTSYWRHFLSILGIGKDLETVSYWNYLSIYSGKDSLYNRLINRNMPVDDIPRFFGLFGLRTHGILNDKLVTEIIYVHSKIMIVDDRRVIIGSANINDRSMLGYRDSEMAVFIEDMEMIDGKMKGQPYQVGKFAHNLRCHLLKEHLDLLDKNKYELSALKVEDPLSDALYTAIVESAFKNTNIYTEVFGGKVELANEVQDCETYKIWRSASGFAEKRPEVATKMLKKINGKFVILPVHFLKFHLRPSILDIGGMYVDASYFIDTDSIIA